MAGTLLSDVAILPAATALLLREDPLEILMLRRHAGASFVPNAWVFPGGIAEPGDHELAGGVTLDAMRLTAARETFEETGIWLGKPLADPDEVRLQLLAGSMAFPDLLAHAPLDLESLVWTSRWITPEGLPKRFDTWFFLTRVSREATATPDLAEVAEVRWIAPADALAAHASGAMPMVFPTLRNLEAILGHQTAAGLLASRRGALIEPVLPVLVNGKPALR